MGGTGRDIHVLGSKSRLPILTCSISRVNVVFSDTLKRLIRSTLPKYLSIPYGALVEQAASHLVRCGQATTFGDWGGWVNSR
jgi:hypothetical protein